MLRHVSVPSLLLTHRREGSRRLGVGSALALALVLLAACTSVTVRQEPPTVGHYNVQIRVDPQNLQDGQKATFNYMFTDQQTGKEAVNLPLVQNATVQTTMVNQDMSWFITGQTSAPVNGSYPVNLRFGPPGSYRLYAEFTSGYTPTERLLYTHTISFGLNPPSLEQPAQLRESPNPRANSFYGVVVSLDTGGALRVGQPARFHYTLSLARNGEPVHDVAPLNNAAGHLYIISADGEEFMHKRALETVPGLANAESPALATIGPDLTFEVEFEHPGLYRTWLEFLYHGAPVTADYVVNVAP